MDGRQMRMNRLGRIVQECWLEVPLHFPRVELQAHVVMPNHLHGLFALVGRIPLRMGAKNKERGPNVFGKPVAYSLSTIVANFKAEVTRRARTSLNRPTLRVWQRNYYERVVRDGEEFAALSRYIWENPSRWAFDTENPAARKA